MGKMGTTASSTSGEGTTGDQRAERVAWRDLPIRCCEDGQAYTSNYYRYSHIGCPGVQYEDNCAAPWDCASKGRCRANYERVTEQTESKTAPGSLNQ